jgi:hypothetical protein
MERKGILDDLCANLCVPLRFKSAFIYHVALKYHDQRNLSPSPLVQGLPRI